MQLQLIDLRASLDPSARETEALQLCDALVSGGTIPAKDAARLKPAREQFVRLWRALEREVGTQTLSEAELPLLRRFSAEVAGAESFARTLLCLNVFAERGLLTLTRADGTLTLRLRSDGDKVSLDESIYLRALRDILS